MSAPADLLDADLSLEGRIMPASNATFFGRINDVEVVYKPVAGERPLWDFPAGTLASREVAAYQISQALGWNLVPHTWLRHGRFGLGMVQLWQDLEVDQHPVTLVPAVNVPPAGWRRVFDGLDQDENPVSLIHEDSPILRQLAVFDVIVNNADRKGSHVLAVAGNHRYGIDHGLTFHNEPKLRTVLWGWLGQDLDTAELDGVERVLADLSSDLGQTLTSLLSAGEIAALATRCERLLADRHFPSPHGDMPAIPWPPL